MTPLLDSYKVEPVLWETIAVLAVAGACGAAMANRGVAIFHDALRSLLPERMEGRMSRQQWNSTALHLSLGLLLGFGLPFSLISGIFLNHGLWLGTDLIGTWFPGAAERGPMWTRQKLLGLVGAILAGALYGGMLALALEGVAELFESLPVGGPRAVEELATPILLTFAVVPALALAYEYGAKHGLLIFFVTLLSRQGAILLGAQRPDDWVVALGMALFLSYALRGGTRKELLEPGIRGNAFPVQGMVRIRRNLPVVAVLGAVYGLACHRMIMMEGPQALIMLAQGDKPAAIGFTLVRTISFAPLKALSSLATGVFALDGLGFVAIAGLISPNAVVAGVAGAVVMSAEALSLRLIVDSLERFPGVLRAADNLRMAMTKLLEIGSLVGSLMMAQRIIPGLGFATVAGAYTLNEVAGTPVVRAAIGPVAVILLGVAVKALVALRLVPLG